MRRLYRRAVRTRLERPFETPGIVGEEDLAGLPAPVRRYLHVTGAVGRPGVHHFRAVWSGRIRGEEADPWMRFTAEQTNFPAEPARFFHMRAVRGGLPVDVYHAFEGGHARMRVRLLSLWPLVDARGPEMDQAETVTLVNDLCLLAPAALLDPAITWEPVDERSARLAYTLGAHTVRAVLSFDGNGDLVDFVSDDRLAASADGKRFVPRRWSTPVGDYRSFGPRRAAGRGEGRWHTDEGGYAYIQLELVDLEVNGR